MAILKSQKPKVVDTTPMESAVELQLRQQKVAEALEETIGRPSESAKEARLRGATSAAISGAMSYKDAERMYAVSHKEIQRFISRVFPSDEDKYKFLEDSMIHNSMLASARFQQAFGEMTAIDAARASTIFAGKATDIRKAREAGFKEAPLNITTIIALEKTLSRLTAPPVATLAE